MTGAPFAKSAVLKGAFGVLATSFFFLFSFWSVFVCLFVCLFRFAVFHVLVLFFGFVLGGL